MTRTLICGSVGRRSDPLNYGDISRNDGTRTRNLSVSAHRVFPYVKGTPPVRRETDARPLSGIPTRRINPSVFFSKALYIHSSNMSKNLIPAVSRRYITRNRQNPAKDVAVSELASAVRFRETVRDYTRLVIGILTGGTRGLHKNNY